MTSKRGAVKRKETPKPAIPVEPRLVVNCICCHCGGVFAPGDVAGGYLGRTCPACGRAVDERSYDASAGEVLAEMESLKDEIAEAGAEADRWSAWAHRFRWAVFKPVRKRFESKAEAARARRVKLEDAARARKNRVRALAKSRYYTSEWHQLTRIPLERRVVGPYRVCVGYGDAGLWSARPDKGPAPGVVAEMKVFQALLERVRDESSPLHGARLVPNIYLPREQRGRNGGSLWDQIDLVALTREAAFVIEVKRRRRHIVAPGAFEEVWSTCDGQLVDAYAGGELEGDLGQAGFEDESRALVQNSRHAVAFGELCGDYPFDRIYEQVVYVGSRSFTADCRGFVDNVNVSGLAGGGSGFADVIEAELAGLAPLMDQSRLDELGESLVKTYGDLNGGRAALHAARIEKLRQGGAPRR